MVQRLDHFHLNQNEEKFLKITENINGINTNINKFSKNNTKHMFRILTRIIKNADYQLKHDNIKLTAIVKNPIQT